MQLLHCTRQFSLELRQACYLSRDTQQGAIARIKHAHRRRKCPKMRA